jgi:hypothetical protein
MENSSSGKLDWCIARLGSDMNWWIEEISDPIHWDLDSLSVIDPRQMTYLFEFIEPLRAYGFEDSCLESAFFVFRIDKDLGEGRIRLVRSTESIIDPAEPLFALPDLMDEEKGAYADFLDHIIKLRVKLLNDLIEFEEKLSIDELEEEIRETQQRDFLEGRGVHVFPEILSILEYVPQGYQLEDDDDVAIEEDETDLLEDDDLPEVDEEIEEDDTMRWENEDEDEEEETEKEWDDDDDEGEDDEEKPKRRKK